jgi:hypothetical protein
MSSSISSLGVYLNTYNSLTLVQSLNGQASTDNSSASNTALRISNILKESEDNSASASADTDSAASSSVSIYA